MLHYRSAAYLLLYYKYVYFTSLTTVQNDGWTFVYFTSLTTVQNDEWTFVYFTSYTTVQNDEWTFVYFTSLTIVQNDECVLQNCWKLQICLFHIIDYCTE